MQKTTSYPQKGEEGGRSEVFFENGYNFYFNVKIKSGRSLRMLALSGFWVLWVHLLHFWQIRAKRERKREKGRLTCP